MLHEPEYCHLFQVMSRKENMLSKLQTKKGTWKIVVRITDMWHVNKHNGRLAINMVLMDHTVIVMLFGFIGLPNLVFFTIFICNCSRVQRLAQPYGKNCSLNLSPSCDVVVHIWFKTSRLLTIILNTKWVQLNFWFISSKIRLWRRLTDLRFLITSMS